MKTSKTKKLAKEAYAKRKKQEKILNEDRALRIDTELKDIFDILVVPAFGLRPEEIGLDVFLSSMWGNREIYSAKLKRDVRLNGTFMAAPKVAIYGTTNNHLKKDSRVWVRIDHDEPDVYGVDIETEDGRWFNLTPKQFEDIESHINREH
jgi:hypothetical protein